MNWRPLLAVPILCTAAALSLTGCTANASVTAGPADAASAPDTGGSTRTGAGTPAVRNSAAPKAGSPKTKAPKTKAPAGDPGDPQAPDCATAHLTITVDDAQGAAGHSVAAIHFRNTGARCWIKGYPTVVGETASGARVAVEKTLHGYGGGLGAGDNEISPYLLEKGDTASAVIDALNADPDGTACKPVTTLEVSPPKRSESVRVAWSGGCAGFEVHPLLRGMTGQAI
ncbi:DUF4232 domain-containing protein [Actinoplanes nipponensis]|nr:DUF4232 domain-containing protein [Actinoplanes nipponensis]